MAMIWVKKLISERDIHDQLLFFNLLWPLLGTEESSVLSNLLIRFFRDSGV